jgi:PTS system mannose-specific IIA component
MIGLVLVTHGRLAEEFIAAAEHVVGPLENIGAVCIGPDDDMDMRFALCLAAPAKGPVREENFQMQPVEQDRP